MRGMRLVRFILTRLLQAVPVVLGVVVLNFLLLQLAPGDAATVLAGEAGGAPAEYVEQLRARFGLDKPVLVQLGLYLKNILFLDLGFSFRNNSPVLGLILDRLWPTLLLMGATLVISVGGGVLLGVVAAIGVRTWRDHLISVAAVVAYATPLFWVGLMLILVFSIRLDWFPTSGMEDVVAFHEGWARVVDIAHHLVLPTVTLSLFYLALYTRLMRATVLEQRGAEYATTARAKGLTERAITMRHVLRNALLPIVTMAGVQVGALLGGSVVVETVFAWPGLGQLAFQSLFARDFNLLLGIFFLSACLVVIVNLVVDVIYVLLDPRIRVGSNT
ncbi:ABC transporter permease [Bosea sp. (in: a-proteobacteria)]|jgi:peptide/nickel transport system permease protein|uniref:ABC transporter permease n=1 Tax=Bosea sp. (in: a-proteobacteria) TaxID=1871050 RepID=UPI002B4A5E58|nr:ABC transporter permease [Bosea sp. (in: a-proteobacteria)]WRH58443.1 MAG: ABC transporter permease [Bosea sp. (in: a-proteobacteria)]